MSIKGKAAIVGYSYRKGERHSEGLTIMGVLAETSAKAIEDAGLRKEHIDGILCRADGVDLGNLGTALADYMLIQPATAYSVTLMGAAGASMVVQAAALVDAGFCTYVLCVGASVEETRRASAPSTPPPAPRAVGIEAPYGAAGAPSGYALLAQRHAYEYGTTDEQRARVAVDQRFNASVNPSAYFYEKPITVEEVLNSRMISSPLRILECVMPITGAIAYIVTSAERARALPNPPVYLLGAGGSITHDSFTHSPRLVDSPGAISSRKAFDMAGVRPSDINMCSIYDCFTITVMVTLEDAGFCKKGESGPFYAETDTTYKGKFPVNTHGGQLSWGQPTGAGDMTHIMDACEQLMGRAGVRQVPNCELAFVEGNGGSLSKHVSLILGRQSS